MTVEELIDELSRYDGSLEVVDYDEQELDEVYQDEDYVVIKFYHDRGMV